MKFPSQVLAVVAASLVVLPSAISANGVGEGRPFQFRTDNQRQVLLTTERTRLELFGQLGSSGSGGLGSGGGGCGQTGNASSIVINGNNNTVTVTQDNSGAQTQTRDFSNNTYDIGGSMFGC